MELDSSLVKSVIFLLNVNNKLPGIQKIRFLNVLMTRKMNNLNKIILSTSINNLLNIPQSVLLMNLK